MVMQRLSGAVTVLLLALQVMCSPAFADDADTCVKAAVDERFAACTRVIAAGQGNLAWAYTNRGDVYLVTGDSDRAIADYDQAIRLDPKYAVAYNNRGSAYQDKGDNDRAIADHDTAIRLDPTYAHAYRNRGMAYWAKGDNDRAIADYDQAIRLDPKYAVAYNNRGSAYQDKGDNDRAIADHDTAIRLDPKYAHAYRNRGTAYRAKGDNDRAIADYDEAIRLDPKYAIAYNNRGVAYRNKGDNDRAIADHDRAILLDPYFTAAYTHRGLSYEKKGDPERARADFNAALTVSQKYKSGKWAHETARARLAVLNEAQARPVATPSPSASGRRVALVIGNSNYVAVPALPNPKRDAEALAAALREIGFQSVSVINDASRDAMVKALSAFGREADNADWALVYFGGHGIEVSGTNYLIPVDARLASDRDVSIEAVSLDQLMGYAEGARKLRILLLDACRDNPFARQMRRTMATRSIGRGLARVEPEGGTLVAYAAKDGQIALDGNGANSPFVTALVKHLPTPGVEINKLFRLVRDDVLAATGRKQEPFVYGSLPGEDFFFVAGK
jgi:tetratricopeptide (TPR) repeat protein